MEVVEEELRIVWADGRKNEEEKDSAKELELQKSKVVFLEVDLLLIQTS
jgi:hypothetical protein